jgi:hypothetical protein
VLYLAATLVTAGQRVSRLEVERECSPLCRAAFIGDETQRDSARPALRGFIDRIVIPPGEGLLQVVGNLGEMLTAAAGKNGAAAVAYVGCGGVQPAVLAVVEWGGVTGNIVS